MPTSTVEDYLKSILRLGASDAAVTVGGIAEDLGVTPGTVSSMMRHLSEKGLIDYVPRKSVRLRAEGKHQALRVVRRHRLIESFLVEVMQLDWSEVHQEAEILEHVISDRLLGRMDEMLGHPSHDPHGDPIPDDLGNWQNSDQGRLMSEIELCSFKVVRISDSDPAVLDWARENGFLPGGEGQLLERDQIAGILKVRIVGSDKVVTLGERVATSIRVIAKS